MIARRLLWAGMDLYAAVTLAQARDLSRATTGPVERGVGLYQGRRIAFEVIDGWAVVEGDIILGRAAELAQALDASGDVRRKGLARGCQGHLWLRGDAGVVEVP